MSASDQPPFGRHTPLAEGTGRRLRNIGLIALLGYPLGLALYLNLLSANGGSIPIDFVAFWSAAKLALQGDAVAAFDWSRLRAEQELPSWASDAFFAWFYPAPFHLVVAPLGLLPFSAAFLIFTYVSAALYALGLRRFAEDKGGGSRAAMDFAIGAPAVISVAITGNVGLLWAGILLFALNALREGRDARAGLAIALLIIKPQLGILLPVALVAERRWRSLVWALIGTAAFLAVSIAAFGMDHWRAFLDSTAWLRESLAVDAFQTRTSITWHGFVSQTFGPMGSEGGRLDAAAVSLAAVLGAGAVFAVWRSARTSWDMRFAVLLLATLVAVPRAFHYELVLALLAAFFLVRAGVGRSLAGRGWLVVLWLLPLPSRLALGISPAFYAAPMLTVSLAVCVWLALRPLPEPARSAPRS